MIWYSRVKPARVVVVGIASGSVVVQFAILPDANQTPYNATVLKNKLTKPIVLKQTAALGLTTDKPEQYSLGEIKTVLCKPGQGNCPKQIVTLPTPPPELSW